MTGYHAEMLQLPGVRTRHNDDYANNNILLSLMYAEEDLDDDVIVSYSDIVYEIRGRSAARRGGRHPGGVRPGWRARLRWPPRPSAEQAEKVVIEDGLSERSASTSARMRRRASSSVCCGSRARLPGRCAPPSRSGDRHGGRPFQASQRFEAAYLTDMLQELIDRGNEVRPV